MFNYKYIISRVLKLKKYKLVFVGDSAGGNLVCVLTSWLIMNNLMLPESIILNYPALSMRMDRYSPSYLNSFDDHLLNFSMHEASESLNNLLKQKIGLSKIDFIFRFETLYSSFC